MSRKMQIIFHLCAGAFGLLAATGILDDAAVVYSWSEAQHHFYVKICIGVQSLLQTAIGSVAQSYNTDGSHQAEPGPTKLSQGE